HIDYQLGVLKLERPLSWKDGQGVALAYSGKAPDIGAYEQGVQATVGATGTSVGQDQPGLQFGSPKMNRDFDRDVLWDCLTSFGRWLDTRGSDSYDPYDTRGTKYGLY